MAIRAGAEVTITGGSVVSDNTAEDVRTVTHHPPSPPPLPLHAHHAHARTSPSAYPPSSLPIPTAVQAGGGIFVYEATLTINGRSKVTGNSAGQVRQPTLPHARTRPSRLLSALVDAHASSAHRPPPH